MFTLLSVGRLLAERLHKVKDWGMLAAFNQNY